MNEERKVVLITGCTKGGIGYHLCEEFATRGCTVYATSRSIPSIEYFTHVNQYNIHKKRLDVGSDEDVDSVVKEIIEEAGRIDILVSNAGVLEVGPAIDVPIDKVQETFNINTFGTLRLAKALVPHMADRGTGTIVVVGSVTGSVPTPWTGIYAASKAALHSITENLQMECAPLGIKCVLVAPGAVKSSLSRNNSERYTSPPGSLYQNYSEAIIARMWASQTSIAMPTKTFASHIVAQVLKKNLPNSIYYGGGSWLWKVFEWLPRWVALAILWRWFGQPNKPSGGRT